MKRSFRSLAGVYRRQLAAVLLAAVMAMLLSVTISVAWAEPAKDVVDRGPAGAPYASGELLVALNPGIGEEKIKGWIRSARAEEKDRLPDVNAVLISFPEIKSKRAQQAREDALEKIRATLEENPYVESADYNYLFQFNYVPNDKLFKRQWGLRKAGYPKAWNRTLGSRAKVGVIDSGIAARHPDLKGNIAAQRDFVDGDRVANDRVGHGTHVSGIVAANTNNRRGVAGGCPGCRLLVAKVGDQRGVYASDAARGINWAVKRGARVVNLSFGAPGNPLILEGAVNRAWRKGAVVVAAAGNENTSRRSYPAAYRRVIAVAATTSEDRRARFSNYGRWVDVAAPGTNIFSTVPGGYQRYSGTSMASPSVAALAGLLASQGLDNKQIRGRIQGTARDLGRRGRDIYYGYGRIDAARAVR